MIDLHNKMIELIGSHIKNIVRDAYGKRQIISTNEFCRGVGKTTALIELAKEKNIPVIVAVNSIAKSFRERFDYEHIYSEDALKSLRGKDIVKKGVFVDEMVSIDKVLNNYINIITGFEYRKEYL